MRLKTFMVLIFWVFCTWSVWAYSINWVEWDYLEWDISYGDIEWNEITIMQYNLWATDDNRDGLLFQWWYNHAYANTWVLERSIQSWETSSEYDMYNWYLGNYQDFSWEIDDQWPCPSGYHVPSMNEWNNLLVSWCENNEDCDERYLIENYEMFDSFWAPYDWLKNQWMFYDDYGQGNFQWIINNFLEDFNLSLPWFRNFDNIVNLWYYWNYWSSNILSRDYGISRFFYVFPVAWMWPHFWRWYGQSIRCFKDSYVDDNAPETLSLELFKGWDWINDNIDISNNDWLWREFVTKNMRISYDSLTLKANLEQPSEGYEWVWYKDNAKSEKVLSGEKVLESYTKFYVFLEQNSYKLIFNKNYWESMSWGEEMVVKYVLDWELADKELPSISRDGYKFLWWNTDPNGKWSFYSPWKIEWNMWNIWDEIVLYAQWWNLWYSWGGWKSSWLTKEETEDYNSAGDKLEVDKKGEDIEEKKVEEKVENLEEKEIKKENFEYENADKEKILDIDKYDGSYTEEFNRAYQFAYRNNITKKLSIKDAKLDEPLTRIEMAKMLSMYAMNVMWKQPDLSIWTVKFNDVTEKQNLDYDNAVTLAYQLWIMWINMPNNNFRPNDIVTRAEFVVAFSRMLYDIPDGIYKSTRKFYILHMENLYSKWIITKTDPDMKEKRWYVMIMLMRSVK